MRGPTGEAIATAVTALTSGIGIEWLRSRTKRSSTRRRLEADIEQVYVTESTKLRQELSVQVKDLQTEVRGLSSDLYQWRDKYSSLYGDYITLKSEHTVLKAQYDTVSHELQELRKRVNNNGT